MIGAFIRLDNIANTKQGGRYGVVEKDFGDFIKIQGSHAIHNKRGVSVVNKTSELYTIEQKKTLLDSFAGKFIAVRWIKKDGTDTARTIQHMQHDLFTLGHASKALDNPVQLKGHYYTCVDVQSKKWINIDLNTLYFVKCGNSEFNT